MKISKPALALLAILLTTCTNGSSGQAQSQPAVDEDIITIGAFNFEESRLLAEIYSGALGAAGIETHISEASASREIMQPALKQGHIDLLPEYVGTCLSFTTLGQVAIPRDPGNAHARLRDELAAQDISVLGLGSAEDANEVAVTSSTADRYGLKKISDLRAVAPEMIFGGSPECASRRTCLKGLEEVYGLRFKDFAPVDPGGPLTIAALEGNEIQAGIVFSTSPALAAGRIVALEDDRHLQPPENIVPIVRTEVLEETPRLADAVNDVSRRLTTEDLQRLNGLIVDHGLSPHEVSELWLEEKGIL